ncbi:unannotated protein [freshwater metagenome]|uniref:Unannotated protein n=1 Tax=freshwater metagenome TaxID=449393 RepID=A0A6J6N0E4_9ZZZZ
MAVIRSVATAGVSGFPYPIPANSKIESQPMTTVSSSMSNREITSSALALAKARARSVGGMAPSSRLMASSSTLLTSMIGSMPAARRTFLRAGEADARTRRMGVTLASRMRAKHRDRPLLMALLVVPCSPKDSRVGYCVASPQNALLTRQRLPLFPRQWACQRRCEYLKRRMGSQRDIAMLLWRARGSLIA